MRLATITNWAYGATVFLTAISAGTMLLAASAHEREREAVQRRHILDEITSKLGLDLFALTDHSRQYINTADPAYEVLYRQEAARETSLEQQAARLGDQGATAGELATLQSAIRWAQALREAQRQALDAFATGDESRARALLFGPEYERQLSLSEAQLERFRDQINVRTDSAVREATGLARLWTTISQIVLGATGLLFLCVLYFVFKRRVLRPVVKLSDVVNRLAAQDYAVEPPQIARIDEIGDIAQAIRLFRETGLERQRLEADRAADAAMRDLLSRMTQRMQGCDSLTDLEEVVARFMPEIAPGYAGRLYILDAGRNAMVEATHWLSPVHSKSEFPLLACWGIRRGLPHQPAGAIVDVPCDHVEEHGGSLPDTVCLPLTAQRQTLGLLYLERTIAGLASSELAHTYLTMLEENVGLALANLRLREALHDMAMADALTGLSNRHQLDAMLTGLLSRASQNGEPLAALAIDVDHFKRFNDTHGHDAGDKVLREVGSVLRASTREGDSAFRVGGEEFLLLLPGTRGEHARARAEELRSRIAALQLEHQGRALGAITVSIGAAAAPESSGYRQLLQCADQALLKAKTDGRDRVYLASPLDPDTGSKKRVASI